MDDEGEIVEELKRLRDEVVILRSRMETKRSVLQLLLRRLASDVPAFSLQALAEQLQSAHNGLAPPEDPDKHLSWMSAIEELEDTILAVDEVIDPLPR